VNEQIRNKPPGEDAALRVLHVCSEIYPLLKTGGLADVTAALPAAQARSGCDVRMLVPGFPAFRDGIASQQLIAELPARFGASAIKLYRGVLPGSAIAAYMIDAPELYDRPGNPYLDAANVPYADNDRRFALLGWLAAQLAAGCDPHWTPQVVHGHDWHAGMAPAYIKAGARTGGHTHGRHAVRTIFTVHNLAYQGLFPAEVLADLGLPEHFFDIHGVEFHGQVSFLKAGLYYSDKLATVSPGYAREIQGPEQGCGLQGLLKSRARDLHGILNGVDPQVWNPQIDPLIPVRYHAAAMAGKQKCKAALQRETGLKVEPGAPLFCMVSRLAEQKGLNLVLAGLPEILRRGGQFVLLGAGDRELESAFKTAAHAHPDSVSVHIGYDEEKSHRIIAGGDVILVPSRFEPCGLTQLYGLIYGTLPLVRRIGGLADTVVDCSLENLADGSATGFVFDAFEAGAYNAAIRRAFALYDRKADWKRVRQTAMQQHFSWDQAAEKYLALYYR
jgi:starch synthase